MHDTSILASRGALRVAILLIFIMPFVIFGVPLNPIDDEQQGVNDEDMVDASHLPAYVDVDADAARSALSGLAIGGHESERDDNWEVQSEMPPLPTSVLPFADDVDDVDDALPEGRPWSPTTVFDFVDEEESDFEESSMYYSECDDEDMSFVGLPISGGSCSSSSSSKWFE
ncbi:hypothetical protein SeLEV6574_g05382 [Synchytrium endobioticum]|nr:hypothetical protein SeLEV6574_g05382 [Synchytrium endobioticum]